MPVKIFDEIDSKLTSILGDREVPENQLLFIEAKPIGLSDKNPPIIQFTFATQENSITPDEIAVYVDNYDVSKLVRYCVHYEAKREACLYAGEYRPEIYLNPKREHLLRIKFQPLNVGFIEKSFNFKVPDDKGWGIEVASIVYDINQEKLILDKINVLLNIPEYIKPGMWLVKPANWDMRYEDETSLPPIQIIEKRTDRYYIMTFANQLNPGKDMYFSFMLPDGVSSEQYVIKTTKGLIDRGGSSIRTVSTNYNCLDCEGTWQLTGTVQPPVPCAEKHIFVTDTTCQPVSDNCDARIDCTEIYGVYEDPPLDYCVHDSYVLQPVPGLLYSGFQKGCENGITYWDDWSYRDNVTAIFKLKAYLKIPYGMPCGFKAGPISLFEQSDVTKPQIVSAQWTKTDPATKCGTDADYVLTVHATDNHCITATPRFYLMPGCQNFGFGVYSWCDDVEDNELECSFLLDDPNVFACVDGLKIVVTDEKGNSNCMTMPNGGELPDELPYPESVTLSFGNRDSNFKQWVNLDRSYTQDPVDPNCIAMIDYPDRGPLIYMEAQVQPPLPDINIHFEFEDPQFQEPSPNNPPTNYRASPGNYSPWENPDLSQLEHNYLWGHHYRWDNTDGNGRYLGDNFNYAYNCDNCDWEAYLNSHNVPSDDPIRFHDPACTPCFPASWCLGAPEGQDCLDMFCEAYEITLETDKDGKAKAYFYTCNHGGDNFRFKVFGWWNGERKGECLKDWQAEIFTVWRKMKVDYAYMEARTSYPPNCNNLESTDQILQYGYQIPGWLGKSQGVFDDCFIEVHKYLDFEDTYYYPHIYSGSSNDPQDYRGYVYYHVNSNPLPLDTVLLLGVDHIMDPCMNDYLGGTWPDCDCGSGPNDHKYFYSYDAVGNIFDWVKNVPVDTFYLDHDHHSDASLESTITAAHELTHCFYNQGYNCDFDLDVDDPEIDHGLMNYNDPRSYLHVNHILLLRAGLPVYDEADF